MMEKQKRKFDGKIVSSHLTQDEDCKKQQGKTAELRNFLNPVNMDEYKCFFVKKVEKWKSKEERIAEMGIKMEEV